jgi:uncharacterized protein (TIGR02147 family)
VTRPAAPDVFTYLDVRTFLRDTYDFKKAAGRGFSFRAFARKVGLRSPNHLKRVIDGERDVTAAMAPRYAEALGLLGEPARYFCDLAAFSRAGSASEKNDAYDRLMANRGYQRVHRLDAAHAAYHANWYIPVIREMAALPEFRPDAAAIASRLLPPISKAEAQEALNTLVALGMLYEDGNGGLRRGEAIVSTGPETRGLHIVNFHRAMLERASASMELVRAADRDISALTFCVDNATLHELKSRLQAFRKELVGLLSERETSGTRVVQLNMQLFPLSQPIPGGDT